MAKTNKQNKAGVVRRFISNPMYQELEPGTQLAVDMAIQADLDKIECDRTLSPAGKEEERGWYLNEGAPAFIENMLRGQQATKAFAKAIDEERAAKGNDRGRERK